MKKLLFFIATFLTACTYGQQIHLGFCGGVTTSNYKSKMDGNDESGNSKLGFTLGAMVNIGIGKNFILQPGVNWVQKGSKDKQTMAGLTAKVSLTTNHIEVPVNFLYSTNGFFIGAGPSFSLGVSGKWKYDDGSNKDDGKVKFGSTDNDDLKAFDLGVNVISGYKFRSGFFIAANFNQGLSNLSAGSATNTTLKSMYASFKLGYLLNGNGKK